MNTDLNMSGRKRLTPEEEQAAHAAMVARNDELRRQARLDGGLSDAVARGSLAEVRHWFDEGANPNSGGLDSETFCRAARRGRADVVALFVQRGADVQAAHGRPLIEAVGANEETVAVLLQAGANPNAREGSALFHAALGGSVGICRMLLDNGADVNAAKVRRLDGTEGPHVVSLAAQEGHRAVVALLVERGADVNAGDGAALRDAARQGEREGVEILLDHGADIHAQEDYALRIAARNGAAEVVRLLLMRGADPAAKEGEARMVAEQAGHADVLAVLDEFQAVVSDLHEAASRGYLCVPSVAARINEHSLALENEDADTVAHCAARAGYFEQIPERLRALALELRNGAGASVRDLMPTNIALQQQRQFTALANAVRKARAGLAATGKRRGYLDPVIDMLDQFAVGAADSRVRDLPPFWPSLESAELPRLKIVPDPLLAGSHLFHDNRHIMTDDAEIEVMRGHADDGKGADWDLVRGGWICTMRDVSPRLTQALAAAPQMQEALLLLLRERNEIARLLAERTGITQTYHQGREAAWVALEQSGVSRSVIADRTAAAPTPNRLPPAGPETPQSQTTDSQTTTTTKRGR